MREVPLKGPFRDDDEGQEDEVPETNVSPVFVYKMSGDNLDENDDNGQDRLQLDRDSTAGRATFKRSFKWESKKVINKSYE